jgi:superkiller protein 3
MRIATRATLGIFLLLAMSTAVLASGDYEAGMNAFKAGKYAEAAAEFQALVDQSPSYDFGYYMLGLSFFKMEKLNEAADNISKSLELNGDKFQYHHALASVKRAQRKNTEAVRILNGAEGLVDNQSKYAFHSLRGFAYADLKKWGDAVNDLEAARKAKKSPQVLEYLGKSYFKLGYNDKAVPILREASRLNPSDSNTLILLAQSLINLGRETTDDAREKQIYGEAMQVATRYRSMNTDDFNGPNLVGKAALGAGEFRDAEEAFKKVIQMKPDFCYAMVNLSKVYLATQRWKEAEVQSKKAAECAPRLAVNYDNLGFALQKQKRLEEALTAYDKAYSIEPSASIQRRINVVKENIRIRDENIQMDQAEREAEEKARAEEEKYQEELEKRKEWEKKRDE